MTYKISRRKNRVVQERLGTAPGTLIQPNDAQAPKITIMAYNKDELIERELPAPEDTITYVQNYDVTWINVYGIGSAEVVETFGRLYELDLLALEDVMNVHHRAKTDIYDSHLFMITRMAQLCDQSLFNEQVSLFLCPGLVITFQEREGDCLEAVRDRIRKKSSGLARLIYADYLAYAIVDAIVDGYFPVLEAFGDMMEELEETVIHNPSTDIIEQVHEIRRCLQILRRDLWPMREMMNDMINEDQHIDKKWEPYLRDCQDHVIQVLDMLENYRERASSLVDLYISSVSQKMNEVMQVLTIIATIFIPLGFLAGLYGMNFDTSSSWNMPELSWAYGYPALLFVMFTVAAGLLLFFRKKGWFGK